VPPYQPPFLTATGSIGVEAAKLNWRDITADSEPVTSVQAVDVSLDDLAVPVSQAHEL
jgi:F0F1-type ATP synthase beta subunit